MEQDNDLIETDSIVKFPGLLRPERANVLTASVLTVTCFLFYLTTLPSIVLPSASAFTLAQAVGALPELSPRDLPWRWLVGTVAPLFGDGLMMAANGVSALLAALCVGLLYLVVYTTMDLSIGDMELGGTLANSARETRRLSTIAGAFASIALAVSAPFRYTALQASPNLFILFLLLLALYLLLRYMAYGSKVSLMLFGLLWGFGISQSGAFLFLLPFVLWKLLLCISRHGQLRPAHLVALVLLVFIGSTFFFLQINRFHASEGFNLVGYDRYITVLFSELKNLVGDIISPMGRIGWLLSAATTILPFIAIFPLASSVIDEQPRHASTLLLLLLLIVPLLNLFITVVSPWRLFGADGVQPLSTAMAAITFGYAVSIFFLKLRYWAEKGDFANQTSPATSSTPILHRLRKIPATFWLIVATAIVVAIGKNGIPAIDKQQTAFLSIYVDKLIDAAKDGEWLVTRGTFDDLLRLRAAERRQPIHLLNITSANWQTTTARLLHQQLKEQGIDLPSDQNNLTLVQTWMMTRPNASSELILIGFPDVWTAGGFEAWTDGIVFRGVRPDSSGMVPSDGLADAFKYYADTLATPLDTAADALSNKIRFLAESVRAAISLSGNNLASQLDRQGHIDEAFDLYTYVSRFDPQNISALLNLATLVEDRLSPTDPDKQEIKLRLDSIPPERRGLSALAMSTLYGNLRNPSTIIQTGSDWKSRGSAQLAMRSFQTALAHYDDTPSQKQLLRRIMAETALRQNDFAFAQMLYTEMLNDDPEDQSALIGLFDLCLLLKSPTEAESLLKRLQTLSISERILLDKKSTLALETDQLDEALAFAEQLRRIEPEYTRIYLLLGDIWMRRYEASHDDENKQHALHQARHAAEQLTLRLGSNDIAVLLCNARLARVEDRLTEARTLLIRAASMTPNNLGIIENILFLDFQLENKEESRVYATLIARRDPTHRFAHYVLALIAFNDGKLNEAEALLEKSLTNGSFPEADRLTALINQARHETIPQQP